MALIPKGKNTPEFLSAVGIFETDLNLAIESLKERLTSQGWSTDEVAVMVVGLLREVNVRDEHGQALEIP